MSSLTTSLIIVMAVLVLAICFITARRFGIKRLVYKRYFSQSSVFAGDETYLVEEIYNNFFLPLFFVDIQAYMYNDLHLPGVKQRDSFMQLFYSRFFLMPFTKIKRSHNVICKHRGWYKLETVHVDFFGGIVELEAKAEIFVYPQPLRVDDENMQSNYLQSNTPTKRRFVLNPFSIVGIREYSRNDPFTSINFKATAKTGRLKVNEKDYQANRNMMIYVNFEQDCKGNNIDSVTYEKNMEKALSYAAYLIKTAISQGYNVGFSTNGRQKSGERYLTYPVNSGAAHYHELLREIAKIDTTVGNSFYSVLSMDMHRMVGNTGIIVISAHLDERIDKLLSVYRNTGNSVYCLML